MQENLTLWTVTENPSDYPGLFVARKWVDLRPTSTILTAPTLHALRDKLPPYLFKCARFPNDDPVIVEVWL